MPNPDVVLQSTGPCSILVYTIRYIAPINYRPAGQLYQRYCNYVISPAAKYRYYDDYANRAWTHQNHFYSWRITFSRAAMKVCVLIVSSLSYCCADFAPVRFYWDMSAI